MNNKLIKSDIAAALDFAKPPQYKDIPYFMKFIHDFINKDNNLEATFQPLPKPNQSQTGVSYVEYGKFCIVYIVMETIQVQMNATHKELTLANNLWDDIFTYMHQAMVLANDILKKGNESKQFTTDEMDNKVFWVAQIKAAAMFALLHTEDQEKLCNFVKPEEKKTYKTLINDIIKINKTVAKNLIILRSINKLEKKFFEVIFDDQKIKNIDGEPIQL